MERQAELAIVRRAYAKQILATARVRDTRIEAAFAAVPREIFLGAGPWQMMCWPRAYISTPDGQLAERLARRRLLDPAPDHGRKRPSSQFSELRSDEGDAIGHFLSNKASWGDL